MTVLELYHKVNNSKVSYFTVVEVFFIIYMFVLALGLGVVSNFTIQFNIAVRSSM